MDQQGVCTYLADLADLCTNSQLQQLQQPFQAYVIPHLTAQALTMLCAACKSLQQIVDHAPVESTPALQHQSAAAFLPKPADSLEVQGRLKQQAASINAVLAAQPSVVHRI